MQQPDVDARVDDERDATDDTELRHLAPQQRDESGYFEFNALEQLSSREFCSRLASSNNARYMLGEARDLVILSVLSEN